MESFGAFLIAILDKLFGKQLSGEEMRPRGANMNRGEFNISFSKNYGHMELLKKA